MSERWALLWFAALAATVVAMLCGSARAAAQPGWAPQLGARLPLDERFVDETGHALRLGDVFGHAPVVLAFVYFECPALCPLELKALAAAAAGVRRNGVAFKALAISVDPSDTPALARARRQTVGASWPFLTGSAEAISRVTAVAGFRFARSGLSRELIHPSGLLIVASDGVVRDVIPALGLTSAELERALARARTTSTVSPPTLLDRLFVLCSSATHVSTAVGAHALAALRALAALCVLAFSAWLWRETRRERRA